MKSSEQREKNRTQCFICYGKNLKLGNCVIFVFGIIFFHSSNNVKLVLSCPQCYYGCIVTDQLSRYLIFFYGSAYLLCYAE